jgi:hypothetical protein
VGGTIFPIFVIGEATPALPNQLVLYKRTELFVHGRYENQVPGTIAASIAYPVPPRYRVSRPSEALPMRIGQPCGSACT